MAFAIAEGHRSDDPTTAVIRALPRNGHQVKHHRALPHGEVAAALATEPPWLPRRVCLLVSNQCVVGLSGSVGLLERCRRGIAEVAVESLVVVPVHPAERGQLDIVDAAPGTLGAASTKPSANHVGVSTANCPSDLFHRHRRKRFPPF